MKQRLKTIRHLKSIEESIDAIEDYITGTDMEYISDDEKTKDAIRMRFIVIGESVGFLLQNNTECIKKYTNIEWEGYKGIRNLLAHDHFVVSMEKIWNSITKHLPNLRAVVIKIRKELLIEISPHLSKPLPPPQVRHLIKPK